MAIRFLLDENLRSGTLWQAVQDHNATSTFPIDAVRVGDEDGPELSSSDDEILAWAAARDRLIVTLDVATLPESLADFCAEGRISPGIVVPRKGCSTNNFVELLSAIAHASDPDEWANACRWVP